MTERRGEPGTGLDAERLSAYLRALGVPNRLELLRKLQHPHALADIRLAPARKDRARSPDRALSRQTVEGHVRRLEDLGLVQGRTVEREGKVVAEYVVNQARLFAVVEELKRLSLLRPVHLSMTAGGSGAAAEPVIPELPAGPCLVLASGPLEGTAFPLAGPGPWTVGRDREATVTLPFDPFVSKENTTLWREDGAYLVQARPGARNGTRVNWRPLAEGEVRELQPADLLGVGRSLLVFREG